MTARVAAALAAALLAASCAPKRGEGPPVGLSHNKEAGGEPVAPLSDKAIVYGFESLDERPVSSDAMAGKVTVLTFVTTGSIDSQAQLAYLVAMAKSDGARVGYAAVALHPRREILLVDALVHTVHAEFPVAIADAAQMASPSAPFGEIAAVPTTVVLDRGGRLVWKKTGLAKADEIRAHMPR